MLYFGWSDCARGVLKGFDDYLEHYKPPDTATVHSGVRLDKLKDHDVK